MKKVCILGSTGSIGVNTINVIREFNDKFKVVSLTTHSNIDLLIQQANEFNPETVVVKDKEAAKRLKEKGVLKCEILEGQDGLQKVTQTNNYDILVSSLVGFAGLKPTVEAIKLGKRIALANKETLVVAGEIINNLVKQYNSELLPIDSEHSAIFQCITGEKHNEIEKLIITASGGPFLNKELAELECITVEQALKHPNWSMGKKITIDSSTLMNKGLEVIEAHWLFNLPKNKIDVVVHPQSIIHSMVEFIDGSVKAQLGLPDMKLPIQYALSYPERLKNDHKRLNLAEIGNLTFYKPQPEKFECLALAYQVMETGGLTPCILNAANEIAVHKFLEKQIKFLQIPELIKKCLNKIENKSNPAIEDIFECDKKTREFATSLY